MRGHCDQCAMLAALLNVDRAGALEAAVVSDGIAKHGVRCGCPWGRRTPPERPVQ
jgi:hypothetical protein